MVGFRGGDNAGDDWYIWLLVEMSMRWVNFKERSPTESDIDDNRCVVVRYTIRGGFVHHVEHWTTCGVQYRLPDAVEWLDYSDERVTSKQHLVSHIRKVEL